MAPASSGHFDTQPRTQLSEPTCTPSCNETLSHRPLCLPARPYLELPGRVLSVTAGTANSIFLAGIEELWVFHGLFCCIRAMDFLNLTKMVLHATKHVLKNESKSEVLQTTSSIIVLRNTVLCFMVLCNTNQPIFSPHFQVSNLI